MAKLLMVFVLLTSACNKAHSPETGVTSLVTSALGDNPWSGLQKEGLLNDGASMTVRKFTPGSGDFAGSAFITVDKDLSLKSSTASHTIDVCNEYIRLDSSSTFSLYTLCAGQDKKSNGTLSYFGNIQRLTGFVAISDEREGRVSLIVDKANPCRKEDFELDYALFNIPYGMNKDGSVGNWPHVALSIDGGKTKTAFLFSKSGNPQFIDQVAQKPTSSSGDDITYSFSYGCFATKNANSFVSK